MSNRYSTNSGSNSNAEANAVYPIFTPCPPGKIRNPSTARCVKLDGAVGRRVSQLFEGPGSAAGVRRTMRRMWKQTLAKPCPAGKIRNPATGRCVKTGGAVGARVQADRAERRVRRVAATRRAGGSPRRMVYGSSNEPISSLTSRSRRMYGSSDEPISSLTSRSRRGSGGISNLFASTTTTTNNNNNNSAPRGARRVRGVRERVFNNAEPRNNNNNAAVPRAIGWLRTRFGRFQLGPHQVNACRLFARPGLPGLLLYYKVGSGKTLASIAAAENLATREGVRRGVVVICPASLRENYKKELAATGVDHRRYRIMSFQGVMNLKHAQRQALGRGKVLIIDEVQNLRTWSKSKQEARMLRAALDVSEVAHKRLLLSGTPVMNYPYEIGPLVALLHGYNEPKLLGEHDEEEIAMVKNLLRQNAAGLALQAHLQALPPAEAEALQARIDARAHGLPLRKDDPLNMTLRAFKQQYGKLFTQKQDVLAELLRCKVLYYSEPDRSKYPTKTETWVEVPMTPKQVVAQFHLAFQDPGTANIADLLEGRVSTVFMTRPRTVNLRLMDEHPKIDLVVARIAEAYARGQKSIAFSTYLNSGLHRVAELLRARGVPHEMYVGGLSDKVKKEILGRYNAGVTPVLLLSEAGKEGLDLKNTAFVHIMEPSWNEEKIEQVIGRAVRYESHTGPDRHVQVYRYVSVFPNPMPADLAARRAAIDTDSILMNHSADRLMQMVTERKNGVNKRFLEWLVRLSDRNLAECIDPANGANNGARMR